MSFGIGKLLSPIVSPIERMAAKGVTAIANTDKMTKIAEWGAKESGKADMFGNKINNFNASVVPKMSALLPIWISAFYIISNLKSDKIPKERKIPLLLNDAIICTFSTAAGMTVAKLFETMQAGMIENLKTVVKDVEKAKMLEGGIKQMMAIAAFTLVFRYLGPVIATPLADKATKFLVKHKLIADPEAGKNKKAQAPAPAAKTEQPKAEQNLNVSLNQAAHKFDPNFESFLKQVHFNPQNSFIA